MNKVAALTLGVMLLGAGLVFVQPAARAEIQTVEVGNKICPVSHEEVGKNGMQPHKVTYKGKTYNLCCSMCEKDFNKDPEKYSKIMDEEVTKEKAGQPSKG